MHLIHMNKPARSIGGMLENVVVVMVLVSMLRDLSVSRYRFWYIVMIDFFMSKEGWAINVCLIAALKGAFVWPNLRVFRSFMRVK